MTTVAAIEKIVFSIILTFIILIRAVSIFSWKVIFNTFDIFVTHYWTEDSSLIPLEHFHYFTLIVIDDLRVYIRPDTATCLH